MKQCPVCKMTQTDETLNFCLVDGTALISLSDEQATFVRQGGEVETAVFSRGGPPSSQFPQVAQPGRSSGSGKKIFLGAAAGAVLVLAIIGGAGAYYYFRPVDKGAVSNPGSADSAAGTDDRKGQEKMGGAPKIGSPGANTPASSIPSTSPAGDTPGTNEQIGGDGTYVGPIIGAPGEITLIVKGTNVTGTVKGTYKYVMGSRTYSDPYTGRVSGTISDTGALNCRLSGNVGGAAFNGTLTGSIINGVASGSWNTKALTAATGTFTASLKPVAP